MPPKETSRRRGRPGSDTDTEDVPPNPKRTSSAANRARLSKREAEDQDDAASTENVPPLPSAAPSADGPSAAVARAFSVKSLASAASASSDLPLVDLTTADSASAPKLFILGSPAWAPSFAPPASSLMPTRPPRARKPSAKAQAAQAASASSGPRPPPAASASSGPRPPPAASASSGPRPPPAASASSGPRPLPPSPRPRRLPSSPTLTASAASSSTPGSAGSRGLGFTDYEIDMLLTLYEERKPIGGEAWEKLAAEYAKWAQMNLFPHRLVDTLRRKFNKLCQYKGKTGDADNPPFVDRAKRAYREVMGKVAAGSLGLSDSEEEIDAPIARTPASSRSSAAAASSSSSSAPSPSLATAPAVPRPSVPKARRFGKSKSELLHESLMSIGRMVAETQSRSQSMLERVVSIHVDRSPHQSASPVDSQLAQMTSLLEQLLRRMNKDALLRTTLTATSIEQCIQKAPLLS